MKIYVNQVPAEGVQQRASYDPAAMDMDRFDVRLTEPFEVEAFITKAERELVVDVDIRAPLRVTCARCLEEFALTVTPEAIFSYTVQPAEVVDITEEVRQEIILAYPMVPVCRPECKGLCIVCGQNFNVVSCNHEQTSQANG